MARQAAISVENVDKLFHVPDAPGAAARPGRRRRPLSRSRGRDLSVLRDISFHVEQGEFFGIVGRNGSGKSTLLKLLASIYRADRGSIRLRGRLAPFLELGVGFHPELSAFDNVVMNGVMMGLRPSEARARFEEIIEFAGLTEHTDLKLKNYSSGMKVRLGFSVMTHVDADVLLIDEVLAVGDAEFQERCGEVFRRMHDEGRTLVLVTHDMSAVLTYCERAMLLHGGRIEAYGDPQPVTDRYLELNMRALADRAGGRSAFPEQVVSALADPATRVLEARLDGLEGGGTPSLPAGRPIDLRAIVGIDRGVRDPHLFVRIDNARGQTVFVAGGEELGVPLGLEPHGGERLRVRATLENHLVGGRYLLTCAVLARGDDGRPGPAGPAQTLRFDVSGPNPGGVLALRPDVEMVIDRPQELAPS